MGGNFKICMGGQEKREKNHPMSSCSWVWLLSVEGAGEQNHPTSSGSCAWLSLGGYGSSFKKEISLVKQDKENKQSTLGPLVAVSHISHPPCLPIPIISPPSCSPVPPALFVWCCLLCWPLSVVPGWVISRQ